MLSDFHSQNKMEGWQIFGIVMTILCCCLVFGGWIYLGLKIAYLIIVEPCCERIRNFYKNTTLSIEYSTICTKIHCIFQKKQCLPNEQLSTDYQQTNRIYSIREDIRAPSEVNGRRETFNNSHDILRFYFYANSVYLPRQESSSPQEDLPPSYDQLFYHQTNRIYSIREDIGTQCEVNERRETFNNTYDISRFYANSVYLPRQESNYPQEHLPPSYDQLFGAKTIYNRTISMV